VEIEGFKPLPFAHDMKVKEAAKYIRSFYGLVNGLICANGIVCKPIDQPLGNWAGKQLKFEGFELASEGKDTIKFSCLSTNNYVPTLVYFSVWYM
jgi:hypothetical protein